MEAVRHPAFDFLDRLSFEWKGWKPLSFLWFVEGWRVVAYYGVFICGLLWIWVGFDSCFDQIQYFLFGLPRFFAGEIGWNGLVELFWSRYGIGTHFSAFVIYGLYFIYLSLHLETLGVHRSMNLALSMFLTMLSISVFEWSWMVSYAVFQGQTWVLTWKTGQNRILFMESVFMVLGVLALTFLYGITRVKGYCFNWNRKAKLLVLASVVGWVFWVCYPFPSPHVTVETSAGTWTSSPYFPQTLWTIDVDPFDDEAVGIPIWTHDDLVHFVNTFEKILITYTILYVLRVKKCPRPKPS